MIRRCWAWLAGRRPGSAQSLAEERGGPRQPPIEFERAASLELLAVDRLVRALYAAWPGGPADRGAWRRLLGEGARLDLSGCRWCAPGAGALGAEDLDDACRTASVRFAERSRTVHVVADVAIVISVCDAHDGPAAWTAVNCLQLRRGRAGWSIHEIVCREDTFTVSEKTADPRPLEARREGRG